MKRPWAMLALGAFFALTACQRTPAPLPPEGQLVLYFDTDAIVPVANAHGYGPFDAYPLFDHVRFDVVPATGASCDCTRDFELNVDAINAGQISFGVIPSREGGSGAGTVRARLFRYADTDQGEPKADTTIDVTFALEPVPAEGVVERTIFLATSDVGVRRGEGTPVALGAGRPTEFHAGTWAPAARLGCAQAPRADEVCVPSGAFWMGNRLEGLHELGSAAERLAVMPPYYLKATEVTVAEYRESGLPVTPWSGGLFGLAVEDSCTFTAQPRGHETDAVNCVEYADARRYCQMHGGDLPTEAQYEYAASALRSALYVWGADPPTCAAVSMCRQGGSALLGDNSCRELGTIGGPAAAGSGTRDRLVLPTGTIVDLIGNVSEWVADEWAQYDDPCWARPGIYVNPLCTMHTPGDTDSLVPTRGGNWLELPIHAAGRFPQNAASPVTGFRCARAAK